MQPLRRLQHPLDLAHEVLRPLLLLGDDFVGTARGIDEQAAIHLHEHFQVRISGFDLLAESESGRGEMGHVNDHQVIRARRGNHGAGRAKIGGGVHAVAFHPQHERAQMLHCVFAVHKENSRSAFGPEHGNVLVCGLKWALPEYTCGCSRLWPDCLNPADSPRLDTAVSPYLRCWLNQAATRSITSRWCAGSANTWPSCS